MEISVQILSWLALILLGAVQLLREKSFREAKQAQLEAKDEIIRARETQISSLKDGFELLDRLSLPRIEEHFVSQQRLLEARVSQAKEEAILVRDGCRRGVGSAGQDGNALQRQPGIPRLPLLLGRMDQKFPLGVLFTSAMCLAGGRKRARC